MPGANSNPLLSTKLFIPPVRRGRVARNRLVGRVLEAVESPLTLICAPAGYGKTTLLSEWIPQNEHCVTWLSLDEGDRDPVRFWRYFIAAVQTLNPQLCKNALVLLESTQKPQIEEVLLLAINDLAALDYRFSHVFDDYHLIENPAIDGSLAFLVEHLPPNASLVISSRRDPALPLARWRARGQLAEIRSADMRFTREETAEFLNQAMKLGLSDPEIAALDLRTEGWIAGLQLAALSIKDHEDRSAFITAFTGSHRYVIDYLVEEVLSLQTETIRQFLLSTCILNRLCAPLCDALTGGTDGQDTLEKLEQDNLFLVSLDDHRGWYRYHHLFAEVLRARLQKGQPELHTRMQARASQWFEQEGFIDLAFQHALSAPDPERAASLVERNSMSMVQRSEVLLIRSWLEQLPDKLVRTRPSLILAHGWILVLTGHGEELEPWLAAPETSAALNAPGLSENTQGELLLLQATLARFQRDSTLSMALARQALQHLSGDDRGLQAGAMYTIGVAHFQMGEISSASQAFAEAARLGETRGGPYMAMIALQELSEIQIKQGKLSQAMHTCQRAVEMASRWGWQAFPAAGLAQIYLGQVFYERNDLDGAIQTLLQGIDLLQSSIEQFILAQGVVALAMAQRAKGEIKDPFATLLRGKDWFSKVQVTDTGAGALFSLAEIRLRIGLGDLDEAIRWFQTCQWLPEDTALGYLQAVTFVRLRLAQIRLKNEEGRFPEGLEITGRLLASAETIEWWGQVLELSVLQALLHQTQGDTARAKSHLERALALAEPEGYFRIFADEGEPLRQLLADYRADLRKKTGEGINGDAFRYMSYVDKLLSAFSPPAQVDKPEYPGLHEPLSERELDILRLIATGRTNQEIAETLVIAVSTVKSHINHLYGKLGTQRRTQAILIARDLGLLSE